MSRVETLIEALSLNHPKGFDLSLERISRLLEKLGNPQNKLPPVFHVAGTNGKGSTLAFIRAILEAQGYRVHVHTSPHLVNWNERYRLAGQLVDDDTLADSIERVTKANDGEPATVFELLSAVMFVLFSEVPADFALVEVGLGGRLDATNVIERPLVSIITPISMDHQAYLGNTLAKIAGEKSGIIKPDIPVACGLQEEEALEVIEAVSTKNNSRLAIARQDFDFYRDATGFVYQDETGLLDLPEPQLFGEHQMANAALAIAAVRLAGVEISEESLRLAMKQVSWPARFQRLPAGAITKHLDNHGDIWIDGGHNPSAGEAIAREIGRMNQRANRRTIMIAGMINTKEPSGFFAPFQPHNVEVIAVPVSMSDAGITPGDLANCATGAGLEAIKTQSLAEALKLAKTRIDQNSETRILFCGSLYLAGEVLKENATPPI